MVSVLRLGLIVALLSGAWAQQVRLETDVKSGTFTIATLPATPFTGQMVIARDANPDCSTGGGANIVICRWTGSTWTMLAQTSVPVANLSSVPGTNGQLLFNNSGAVGAEDPVVSGPDAVGASPTKPPVQVSGIGADGFVHRFLLDNSGDLNVIFPTAQAVTVSGVATASNQTSGAQKTQIVDSSGNVIASTSNALNVSANITNSSLPVTGTFFQATQPVSIADGSQVTLGAKADAKNSATDTTAITIMQVMKEISFMTQNPATTPVTGTFFQATQPISCASGATCPTNSTLQAGSAIVGKVGIDQTTPGTTNAVSATNFPTTVDTNTGNASASTPRVVLASNQPAVTVAQSTAANLNATVVGTGTFAVQNTPQSSSGSASAGTAFFASALTTATTVKASAGNLWGGSLYNPNATTCFLQVFNAASGSVTLGTTTPIFSFAVPNGPATSNLPGLPVAWSNFGTAISVAATTTATGASTCATGMTVNLSYS